MQSTGETSKSCQRTARKGIDSQIAVNEGAHANRHLVTKFDRTERPNDDLWIHHFATAGGMLAVAWSRTGTTGEEESTLPRSRS